MGSKPMWGVASVATLIAFVVFGQSRIFGQEKAALQHQGQSVVSSLVNRVAVVDLARVFKHHQGFRSRMDDLKKRVEQAERDLVKKRESIDSKIARLNPKEQTSPKMPGDIARLRKEIAQLQVEFDTDSQAQKESLMKEESTIYLSTYKEVEGHVSTIAESRQFDLVYRIDGQKLDAGSDRSQILGEITRPIIYFRSGVDITEDVINRMRGPGGAAGGSTAGGRAK